MIKWINVEQEDRNPGSLEDMHKKCKDVFPMFMEGYKFLVNKGLSQHFQVIYIYIIHHKYIRLLWVMETLIRT